MPSSQPGGEHHFGQCTIRIPASAIIQYLTGIPTIRAVLPWVGGVVLIAVSTILTVISGLLPAGSASRKDPVVALRTE